VFAGVNGANNPLGDDVVRTLTPLPAGSFCNDARGYRELTASRDRVALTCFFGAGSDTDVVLLAPGPNRAFENSGAVGRDDVVTNLAATGQLEELPALHHETAAWLQSADLGATWSLVVRRPGADAQLGTGDDATNVVVAGLPAAARSRPALYLPDDAGVPACRQGVLHLERVAGVTRVAFTQAGPDGNPGTGDDVRTTIKSAINSPDGGGVKLEHSGHVLAINDNQVLTVVSAGADGCFGSDVAPGDDERTTLDFGRATDVSPTIAGWFEFAVPQIIGNQIVFHDNTRRRVLQPVFGAGTNVRYTAGPGFAVVADESSARLIEPQRAGAVVGVRRSTDATSFASVGGSSAPTQLDGTTGRLAVLNRRNLGGLPRDAVVVHEPGADGRLFTPDDTTLLAASDLVGDDNVVLEPDTFRGLLALSDRFVGFLTGTSLANRPQIRGVGSNGVFDGDGSECTLNTVGDTSSFEDLSAHGPRLAVIDGNVGGRSAARVYEPTTLSDVCAPATGAMTTLTQATDAVPNVVAARVKGQRVVALQEPPDSGSPCVGPSSVVVYEAAARFSTSFRTRTSCTVPERFCPSSNAPERAAYVDGIYLFLAFDLVTGGRGIFACDPSTDTVRKVDAFRPPSDASRAMADGWVDRQARDDSLIETRLFR